MSVVAAASRSAQGPSRSHVELPHSGPGSQAQVAPLRPPLDDVPASGKLRDTAVDGMYAELKENGTRAQRAFFDQYVRSRECTRSVSEQLSGLLANIGGDADALDSTLWMP